MSGLRREDFVESLRAVVDDHDAWVVLYSGLWTFGHRIHRDVHQVVPLVWQWIRDALGSERTLILPTYTYGYAKTRRYDPKLSKSETGVLTQHALQQEGVLRTESAFNSYAVLGPGQSVVNSFCSKTLWGEGSLFAYMDQHPVRIVTLGLPWHQSCSYFHRMEEKYRVPYRYWKDFPGVWVQEGREKFWQETMYVRSLQVSPQFAWQRVEQKLAQRGFIRQGHGGGAFIESVLSPHIDEVGREILKMDRFGLVTNADELVRYIDEGGLQAEQDLAQKEALQWTAK